MSIDDLLLKNLKTALSDSVDQVSDGSGQTSSAKKFNSAKFFSNWFDKTGCAYFFLFKKNLKVTNIQHAELISLIRSHCTYKNSKVRVEGLQFLSRQEFIGAFEGIVASYGANSLTDENWIEKISSLYSSLVRPTVVVESFFGSSIVFIPAHLQIDLRIICAYSGYIHSCGKNIYTRNVLKATEDEFFSSVEKYIKEEGTSGKVRFTVYAHEDFTSSDRDQEVDLRDGLDDVKIHIEKYFMGAMDLIAVSESMEEYFKDSLKVSPRNGRNSEENSGGMDDEKTIWLLVDHAIGEDIRQHGDEKFYICYAQEFANKNPHHIFDENKPAWISHTTIPHTLAGAMINLTSPLWIDNEKVSICDPFVGTGTTWLESLKFENVIPFCSDINQLSPLLAADNKDFFNLSSDELKDWIYKIERIINKASHSLSRVENESVNWFHGMVDKVIAESDSSNSINISKSLLSALRKKSLFDRVLFYIGIRSWVRPNSGLRRRSELWGSAFPEQAKELINQIKILQKQVEVSENYTDISSVVTTYQTKYSEGTTLCYGNTNANRVEVRDATALKNNAYDVIIADPPYGFNTEDDPYELSLLYRRMIESMVLSLKYDGQIVLCLPEMSFTGKVSPFFTHKEVVIQQLFAEAARHGREVLLSAYLVPPPSNLYRPPYYWESAKALRRSILHFRLRKISKNKTKIKKTPD